MLENRIKNIIDQYVDNKIYIDLAKFENGYYLDIHKIFTGSDDEYILHVLKMDMEKNEDQYENFFSLRSCYDDKLFNSKKHTYACTNNNKIKINILDEKSFLENIDILEKSFLTLLEIKEELKLKNDVSRQFNYLDTTFLHFSRENDQLEVAGSFDFEKFKEILNQLKLNRK